MEIEHMAEQNDDKVYSEKLRDFILLTGRANPELAEAIGKILKVEVTCPIIVFPMEKSVSASNPIYAVECFSYSIHIHIR